MVRRTGAFELPCGRAPIGPCRPAAFSLIELMVVVIASSVVLAGFLGLYTTSVSVERRAGHELELRYLAVFAHDRLLDKLREASAILRVSDTAYGPVLVYERAPLRLDAGAGSAAEDLASSDSFTGVVYLSGERLVLRERRPIGSQERRLVGTADLSSEAAANTGAASREAVVAFLDTELPKLPDTREEVLSSGVTGFELRDSAVTIGVDPGLGIRRFGAGFRLTHRRPPATI